jgi:hypothetical protein
MRIVCALFTFLAVGSSTCSAADAPAVGGASFSVRVPAAMGGAPLDGRLILLLSHDVKREPRDHVEPNEPLDAPYTFGLNVDALAPGAAVVVDDTAFGWPAARLSAVPSGDYFVQAVLNRYETFHLADGRVLKLSPDKGEGQHWGSKPGNLYSKPMLVHIDSAHPQRSALILDSQVAAIVPNAYSRLHYNVQYLPIILKRIAAAAPAGSDLSSWRY